MKYFRYFFNINNNLYLRNGFRNVSYAVPKKVTIISNNIKLPLSLQNIGKYSTENDEAEEYSVFDANLDFIEPSNKHFLFIDSKDFVINELNDCLNVEDVWRVLNKHKDNLTDEQITQTVIILKELQRSFCNVHHTGTNPSIEFSKILQSSKEFEYLLNTIINRLDNFNTSLLSYVFLYLQRLNVNIEDSVMFKIGEQLKLNLENKFDLSDCSRFIRVIFLESSVRPYYMSFNLIPRVLEELNKCDTAEDLSNISVCLHKMHNIVTPTVLEKYIKIVEEFLNLNKLDSLDHNTILKIITFLSLPQWREENVELMSRCMLLLKNAINKLDIPYLLLLYEVFFKIQEPGDLLNDIQRNAAKHWQQFEESGSLDTNTSLKLFSSLLFFSSPLQRIHLRKDVDKLLKFYMDSRNLVLIRKIFSYVKISDKLLCAKYWEAWSSLLNDNPDHYLVSKSCLNYMLFQIDIEYFRNINFENQVLDLIKKFLRKQDVILGEDLSMFLAFVINYCKDKYLLQILLNKLKRNPRQIKPREILLLSQTFLSENTCLTKIEYAELNGVLTESTKYLFSYNFKYFENNLALIKAAILRANYEDESFIEELIFKLKEIDFMSSKLLENICYIFLNINCLIPEVFNKMTEYVIKNKNNIIGFNAEKLLFLSFHLAYYPINADKFFQAVTDVIIRDQERLSGLSFLQSALALSFFNKLPSFLVKQIFNEEFMDRLDNELENCYSKEKYPQRVRQTLMYLNRVVCLEYPEFNIPWFHEKYIKGIQHNYFQDYTIPKSIKEYLIEIVGNEFLENVKTPYGYHIDFVVNLNNENKIPTSKTESIKKRVALILLKNFAYTKFYVHLKGTYQMKVKHLEMMGYNVSIINFNDWANLLYPSEKIDYLKNLIWSDHYNIMWATKR